MITDTLLELLNLAQTHLPELPGPAGPLTALFMLARTAVRHGSLLWLTRGATPEERALILSAAQPVPRPSWRSRGRHLARRLTPRR
ncbi:hypothetical protein ACFWGM_21390 [Streptomyces roseolus]|uniref:hypothetical protein n=1 Tax=Streptomyces TaxID=1883 RepID=UPI003637AE59